MQYKNPIIKGFNPDPSICRVGDDYYLVTSSFEYFPGVPIYHSKDLVNWEQIGYCLTRKSQLNLDKVWPSGGIYAPTIRYNKGIFYMVTTNVSNGGNFYVTAEDPKGEWSEPIWVEQGGIDPSLFFDEDGKVYFTSTSGGEGKSGIGQAEIDITTGKLLTPTKFLWAGSGGRYPEAPHLYKINDWYYLMIAEGGTEYGHMETITRSKSPWGPFEECPHNPILTHRDRGAYIIQGTGHGDLVQTQNGDWWIVFLGFRTAEQYFHHLGRESFLAPVLWDEEGWPVVNNDGTVDIFMDYESQNSITQKHDELSQFDDFDSSKLDLCWNFLRNPYHNSWSVDERKGYLTLHGSRITLSDIDSPAFIGRRQQHFDCHFSTKLEFNPVMSGDEAGLTILYNNEFHYDLAVIMEKEETYLVIRKNVGDICFIAYKEKITNNIIYLDVVADKLQYKFGFGYKQDEINYVSTGRTQFLSTEATKCSFTGVFIGLYTTGNGEKCSSPAYFDYFTYDSVE